MAKVISVRQPHASLIAFGEKRNETRSQNFSHRGILLIHSSKSFGKAEQALCAKKPFMDALIRHGITRASQLPLGQIIAEVNLWGCVKTEQCTMDPTRKDAVLLTEQEEQFGDYSRGRFALLLKDARLLREPIPASGQLGLWEFDDVWSDV